MGVKGRGSFPFTAKTKPHSWQIWTARHTLILAFLPLADSHAPIRKQNQAVSVCASALGSSHTIFCNTGGHAYKNTHTFTHSPNPGCILGYCTDRVNTAVELPFRADLCEFVREDLQLCARVCVCAFLSSCTYEDRPSSHENRWRRACQSSPLHGLGLRFYRIKIGTLMGSSWFRSGVEFRFGLQLASWVCSSLLPHKNL